MGCKESDTTQHSSATTKKKIMPYVTTWINLEDIMLKETSANRRTDAKSSHGQAIRGIIVRLIETDNVDHQGLGGEGHGELLFKACLVSVM